MYPEKRKPPSELEPLKAAGENNLPIFYHPTWGNVKEDGMEKSKIIKYAETRLADAINNGTNVDIQYWCGYLDGARAQTREDSNGAS